jgi:hypothetical protein
MAPEVETAESQPLPPPKPPRIALAYGIPVVILGLGLLQLITRSFWRGVQQGGVGLYALPAGAIASAPALLLVYLAVRTMRGERLAVYALTLYMLVGAGAIMAFDTRRGGYVLGLTVVGLSPLCIAACRESGGFH